MKKIIFHNLLIFFVVVLLIGLSASSNDSYLLNDKSSIVSNEYASITTNSISSPSGSIPNIEINTYIPEWIERTPLNGPDARSLHTMVYDSMNDKTILYGGLNWSNLGDTWAYDYQTNTWQNMSPVISPQIMSGMALVYDPSIQKTVLFGSGQTWTYDYLMNNWTQQFPQVSPGPLIFHSMVYDTLRQKVILMGGAFVSFETWELDTSTFNWTNLNAITPISTLYGFSSAYDEVNDKIIIYGGQNASDFYQSNTLAFDYQSNIWTKLNTINNPPVISFAPMGYDPIVEKSFFYGGRSNAIGLDDTWSFDYSTLTWELIPNLNTPSARFLHTMIYNSEANTFIIFGGSLNYYTDELYAFTPFDIVVPQIQSPGNQIMELGSSNNSISWIIQDVSGGNYTIKLDNQTIKSGEFIDGDSVDVNLSDLSDLEIGNYSLVMSVTDTEGNLAIDQLNLEVVDNFSPSILSPGNTEFEFGSSSYSVSWQIFDPGDGFYDIQMNGKTIDQNNFTDGQIITIVLVDLLLDNYTLSITAIDNAGNIATDTILLSIVENSPPTIIPALDQVISILDLNRNITWILEDQSPASYKVTQNGTLIFEGTWSNGDRIVVNLDTLSVGTYLFNITVADIFDNIASDAVLVRIFDPGLPSLSNPDDILITAGQTGWKITWTLRDNNPTEYYLERNGIVIENGTYQDFSIIEVNLDGYSAGNYNFTLTIYDADNNTVSDFVEVQIFPTGSGIANTNPSSGGSSGGAAGIFRNISPNVAVGVGAFVAVAGGAYFIIRRRSGIQL